MKVKNIFSVLLLGAMVMALGQSLQAEEKLSAHFQMTYIWQNKPAFSAAYTGPKSLLPTQETGYTLSATLFLGFRPWPGAELYLDPEMFQSVPLSNLTGLGGLTNGENQKGGGPEAKVYRARMFLRQTWGLGGDKVNVESATNNQLAGQVDRRRLVMTIGNLALVDVFDNNAFSHDPRTQFLNWAFLTHGAFDYAADARGYSWGLALEYYDDAWAFRVGRFAEPKESNGMTLDSHIFSHFGDQVEVEHAHKLAGQMGKLRLLAFRNVAKMGAFRDALEYARVNGGNPDVGNVRKDQPKYGFGISLEQNLAKDAGLFARASWNDGHTETYSFTEIERSLSSGLAVKGIRWRRPSDTLAVAIALNGVSTAHRDYLIAGGHGFFIGDGRLSYRAERIVEAYYNLYAFRGVLFSVDFQFIANPAYNKDRGPVHVFAIRIHTES